MTARWDDSLDQFPRYRLGSAALLTMIRTRAAPRDMPTRVVAIDGGGGAGKSTLAAWLAAPVVHTDDFASWDNPLDWWPRLLVEVLEPLAAGASARFRRYDWERRRMGDEVALPPRPPFVVLEGVSALRLAFAPYVAFGIWVHSPADLRLRRGLERDGEAMTDEWQEWFEEEDDYAIRERPLDRADIVLSGTEPLPNDADGMLVALQRS